MQGAGHLLASSWLQHSAALQMHKDGDASMSGAGCGWLAAGLILAPSCVHLANPRLSSFKERGAPSARDPWPATEPAPVPADTGGPQGQGPGSQCNRLVLCPQFFIDSPFGRTLASCTCRTERPTLPSTFETRSATAKPSSAILRLPADCFSRAACSRELLRIARLGGSRLSPARSRGPVSVKPDPSQHAVGPCPRLGEPTV